jgi:hypothetical protein
MAMPVFLIESRLSDIIHSGKYDIVKIQKVDMTGYLLAAEVYYRLK